MLQNITPRLALRKLMPLLICCLCAGGMRLYWSHVPQNLDASAPTLTPRKHPLTDLYAQWFGTRELLLHHRDPYGDDVTHELQTAYYGKELEPSAASLIAHQQRFAYPVYVVFLLAPTVTLEFRTVQMIAWCVLVALTACSIPLWARSLRAPLSPLQIVCILIVTFTSIPVMQGLSLLQLGLLVAALLAAATAAVVSGRFLLAGALLAIATIKPQMSLLPIAWFMVWVSGDWRSHRRVFFGFATALAALVLGAEYLMPGWLPHYAAALRAYAVYTQATSVASIAFPLWLSWLVSILALAMAAFHCWRSRAQSSNSLAFAISLGFAMALTLLIVPTVIAPFNQVLLLPVVLLIIQRWNFLWHADRLTRYAFVLCCAFGFLPWILALILDVLPAAWQSSRVVWQAPLSASLALPFAALGCLLILSKLNTASGVRSKAGAV